MITVNKLLETAGIEDKLDTTSKVNVLDENILRMENWDQVCAYMQECCSEIINEAYFGRDVVKDIEAAMAQVRLRVIRDPHVNLMKTPEAKALEKAVCKVFGFRKCTIYWSEDYDVGPCTLPKAKIIESTDPGLRQGTFRTNKKVGFYDQNHTIYAVIQMDNHLFTDINLSASEATAVLLHEIGHNFDHTWFSVFASFVGVIETIVDLLMALSATDPYAAKKVADAVENTIGTGLTFTDAGREAYMAFFLNLKTQVIKAMPAPIQTIAGGIAKISNVMQKIFNMLLSTAVAGVVIPRMFLTMPISYGVHFFTRKSETYADSFAAAYGYASEQASALTKLENSMLTFENSGPLLIFENMALLVQEVGTFTMGGHGSTQQRMNRMIDSMKRDLKSSDLDRETKKALEVEIERAERTYQKVVNCNDDERRALVAIFRQLVECWYRGTDYKFISALDPANTYAN